MIVPFPVPRYEVRELPRREYRVWDRASDAATTDAPRTYAEAQRMAATLNREYQRWLADRFYDRAERGLSD